MPDPITTNETPTAPAALPAARRGVLARLWRFVLALAAWATVLAIALGMVGQVVRDRNVLLALLMYLPLAPLGLAAFAFDLLRRGRSIRPRWTLAALGMLALAWGTVSMVGVRPPDPAPPGATTLTLLHWNMQSGGRHAAQPRWDRAAEEILSRKPDLIVLSEAPPDDWLFNSLHKVGRGWRTVHIQNDLGGPYWYKPLICSQWPLRMEGRVPVRNGVAMSVAADVRGKMVRLLVVDGISWPTVLRTPFLEDIAAACREAARRGQPYDVVVGDFNAVGRSLGFDTVRSAADGYREASNYRSNWRGTWPYPLPVYDIDHVLVRTGVAVTGAELFSPPGLETDHRGQYVHLALPPAPRTQP
jgi:endonuclease/exonuclease/phosphatase family metal-dependent hydrolase